MLVGALALGAVAAVRGVGVPPRPAWPGIVGSGVFWFALYMVALNWGERHADAGTAALIVGVGPVLVAFLAGWLLREGFPARLLVGLAIGASTDIMAAWRQQLRFRHPGCTGITTVPAWSP